MPSITLGVASRLVGGLIAITIFAMATSALAIFGFNRFQSGFQLIAESEMPGLINAAELTRQSESIVANAPALGIAQNQQVRRTVLFRMNDQISQFETLATSLFEAGISSSDLEQLRELKTDLVANLKRIDGLVEHRLDADLESGGTIRTILDIGDRLRRVEVTADPKSKSVSSFVDPWKSNAQEAVNLMLAGQAVLESARLAQLHKASIDAFGRADASLGSMPGEVAANVQPIHDEVRRLVEGRESVFLKRAERLDLDRSVQGALRRNKIVSDQFIAMVSNIFYVTQEGIRQRVDQYNTLISNRTQTLAAMVVFCVIGAGTIFFYINGNVVRRLKLLQESMSAHVAGRTVDIPTAGSDEISDMARSLEFFVDAIARRELALRQSEQRLIDAIETISEGFTLYDADDRLVLSNSRYRDVLYPGHPDVVAPGTSFEATIRRAVKLGLIEDAAGREEEWIATRLAAHRNPTVPIIQQRKPDRWIQVSERRTDDGGTVAVYSDISELKRREADLTEKTTALEALSAKLAKYLAPQVYSQIFTGEQTVEISSKRKKLTIFFSDIADFTETTESLESEELTLLLNRYLTEMTKIALAHGATIDKYIGDAVMLFFGDPESLGVQEDATACVRMAITMQRRMRELQSEWQNLGLEKPFQLRIGINTGFCTVGNFGSEDRMDYTIIGNEVNLAARLQSNSELGGILLTPETYALVKDFVLAEEKEPITVKGFARPIRTYSVLGIYNDLATDGRIVVIAHPHL